MKVRYIGAPADVHGDKRALTVGHDYVVLALQVVDDVQLMLLTDETREPGWFSAASFDIVSDAVPSNWKIGIGLGGNPRYLELAPAAWLEPGFLEDFWGDGDTRTQVARSTFERELAIILRESE